MSDHCYLPKVAFEVVLKVCRLALPLAAADVSGTLHAGPVDGDLAEEQAQAFGPGLEPPGRQVEGHGQGLAGQDGWQHHRLCERNGTSLSNFRK